MASTRPTRLPQRCDRPSHTMSSTIAIFVPCASALSAWLYRWRASLPGGPGFQALRSQQRRRRISVGCDLELDADRAQSLFLFLEIGERERVRVEPGFRKAQRERRLLRVETEFGKRFGAAASIQAVGESKDETRTQHELAFFVGDLREVLEPKLAAVRLDNHGKQRLFVFRKAGHVGIFDDVRAVT